jgi:hypothetical protein
MMTETGMRVKQVRYVKCDTYSPPSPSEVIARISGSVGFLTYASPENPPFSFRFISEQWLRGSSSTITVAGLYPIFTDFPAGTDCQLALKT